MAATHEKLSHPERETPSVPDVLELVSGQDLKGRLLLGLSRKHKKQMQARRAPSKHCFPCPKPSAVQQAAVGGGWKKPFYSLPNKQFEVCLSFG